jgi:hypothetical protein
MSDSSTVRACRMLSCIRRGDCAHLEHAMTRDDDLHVRLGRIEDGGGVTRVARGTGSSRENRRATASIGASLPRRCLRPRPGRQYRGRATDDEPDTQRCRQSARRPAPGEGSAASHSLGGKA